MPRQTFAPRKKFLKFLMFTILLAALANFAVATNGWRVLAPGIEYQKLSGNFLTPWSHLHAFRINLKDNQLTLVAAKDLAQAHASIDEYAQHTKALLAINGGFFDDNYKPLGLRINEQQLKNPIKNISWWGIFYIKNQRAHISNIKQFTVDNQIDFAIQSGPRLLINNQIPPLKPGRAERSALGITQDGHIIMVITDNLPLSTTELAKLMQAPPLNCEHALNLDGGGSSQLSAHLESFQLKIHGFSNVSDAVIVMPRKPL